MFNAPLEICVRFAYRYAPRLSWLSAKFRFPLIRICPSVENASVTFALNNCWEV